MRHLLYIPALLAATVIVTGCGGGSSATSTRAAEARTRAIEAAAKLIATSHTDTMAMQHAILDAKAVQSEYILAGDTAAVHAIEHLGATYLRNEPQWKARVLYFGPMGCRTGFYLLLAGFYESRDILPLMDGMFRFIAGYEGEIPGASAKDCGNYLDMNLPMARYHAEKYIREVLDHPAQDRLIYPD